MMEIQRRYSCLQSLNCGKICNDIQLKLSIYLTRRRKTAHRPREGDLARAQWPRTRQLFKNLKGNENKNIKNVASDQ